MKNNNKFSVNQVPLEERVKNLSRAHFTEQNAVRNCIKKIVLMPFSDFMFFYTDEYLFVMREFTGKNRRVYPDILVGQILEYVSEEVQQNGYNETGCAGNERIMKLLDAVSAPFLKMYDTFKEKNHTYWSNTSAEELIRNSPWKYVRDSMATKSLKDTMALERPLQERVFQIMRSKQYKAEVYGENVNKSLIPTKDGWQFFQLLYCATFQDYMDSLKALSYTKLTPTKVLYNKLEQSHTGYSADKAILEYYLQQDKTYFRKNIYALFIHPMAQVSATIYAIYLKRKKAMEDREKGQ